MDRPAADHRERRSPEQRPDRPCTAQDYERALAGAPLFTALEHYAEIDSTQVRARALAAAGAPAGSLVVAERQRAGQGRHGRSWFSPPGGLWCSLVLRAARRDFAEGPPLALLAGLAIARGIEARTGLRTALRWPNDVMRGQRKLAGVLVDLLGQSAVLGLGIDVAVAPADFPPELRQVATSLLAEGALELERPPLLRAVLQALATLLAQWEAGEDAALVAAVAARMPAIGRQVRVCEPAALPGAPPRTGRLVGLGPRGELLLAPAGAPPGAPPERIWSGRIEILEDPAGGDG
ncbi:MAG: hypothetical protein KatS3mg102_0092 [Planctomycetota bacterium]|nr:MAG: hypothetical protein KatS3mg102_0092 [Planctomycetota bacterium]